MALLQLENLALSLAIIAGFCLLSGGTALVLGVVILGFDMTLSLAGALHTAALAATEDELDEPLMNWLTLSSPSGSPHSSKASDESRREPKEVARDMLRKRGQSPCQPRRRQRAQRGDPSLGRLSRLPRDTVF